MVRLEIRKNRMHIRTGFYFPKFQSLRNSKLSLLRAQMVVIYTPTGVLQSQVGLPTIFISVRIHFVADFSTYYAPI